MLNVYLIFPLCILNLKCGFSVFVDFLSGFSVLPPNLVRFCGFGNPSRPPLKFHRKNNMFKFVTGAREFSLKIPMQ